jgi:hypothetical protein
MPSSRGGGPVAARIRQLQHLANVERSAALEHIVEIA